MNEDEGKGSGGKGIMCPKGIMGNDFLGLRGTLRGGTQREGGV